MAQTPVLFLIVGLGQPVLVEHEPMHRIVFENAIVRVIDASVEAGQAMGDSLVRFIDVELRGPRGTATGGRREGGSHATEIDNERVVVHRVRVAPGGRVEPHQHAGPLLEVVVSGDLVARGDTAAALLVPGSHAWRSDGRVPRIENVGSSGFELVEIEWKP